MELPKLIKLPLLFALFLVSAVPAYTRGKDDAPRTRDGWISEIKKDAKVSTLITALGEPDMIKADQGLTRYYFMGKCYAGTSSPEALIVIVEPYKGEKLVIGMTDGTFADIYWFPWSGKVHPGL